ncbi:MAG: bifunctional transaldolase/phosoglucose isomerase, partial [Candidatus Limnocylindrales bacterium]
QLALEQGWAERLMARDASLWSDDPAVQAAISERLGWLESPSFFADRTISLEAFGEGIRAAGFSAAVLAGMGGSSLAPDVLATVFGAVPDWLPVRILDSTDPVAVAAAVDDLDPLSTLFIVSTKSGTTSETLAFQADAWARAERAMRDRRAPRGEDPGELMVAITDPEASLRAIPHHDELREVFLNPPDVGGRYSALTYVGLVPASLLGIDLDALLARALVMLADCQEAEAARNPGLALGLAIGTLARDGRDKLTFVADPEIAIFGAWAEQLLAESTGKHGVGIVPVHLEPLGRPEVYGSDRVFLRLTMAGSDGPATETGEPADVLLDRLNAAGHPVIRIDLGDPIDLGAEFVRWEVATAFAGAVLGIDPFDQPNVEESKRNTRAVLADLGPEDDQPIQPLARGDGLTLYGDSALRLSAGPGDPVGELRRHFARLRPLGYVAFQAYIAPTASRTVALTGLRTLARQRTKRATTVGYGPTFLHSTGQLHKGGAPIGCFLQLTADHPADRPIPGQPYTFGQLIDAQAAGDLQALEAHDLPVLRVHLGADPDAGLAALGRALAAALGQG